jgi:hypothetical protein
LSESSGRKAMHGMPDSDTIVTTAREKHFKNVYPCQHRVQERFINSLAADYRSRLGSLPRARTKLFLRDRLKAGQRILIPLIMVRVHVPQPSYGSVVEWFMALVLKTSDSNRSVGSNPTASANY